MKKPIRHTFQPDPKRESWCELCGCKKDDHAPKPSEPLTAWQKKVKR